MYREQRLTVREEVCENHRNALNQIPGPGTWFSGEQRTAILAEARHARDCTLCQTRKIALSPYSVSGKHDTVTPLASSIIEVIHRLVTDSGRLTESWFKQITGDELSAEEYVEIVGVVATSIVIDSFARGLGCAIADPGEVQAGEPDRQSNPRVFNGGAWLPMLDVPQEEAGTGLPTQPNIGRAMGLVPSAIGLFFPVMRCHYSLGELDFAISRPQVELIASRISSHNQCFY